MAQRCFHHVLSADVSYMAGLDSRGYRYKVNPLVEELQNCTMGNTDTGRGRIVAVFMILSYSVFESHEKRRAWSEGSDPRLSRSPPPSLPILIPRPWHCHLASQLSSLQGSLASAGLPMLRPSHHSLLPH